MEQIQILWVGHSISDPEFSVKRHDHPFYHLFYLASGQLDMTLGKEQYRLDSGSGLLVPPQTLHSYDVAGSADAEYLEVKFSIPGASSALDALLSHLESPVFANPVVAALLDQLVQEYNELGSLADDSAASYLLAALNLLTAQPRRQKRPEFRYIAAEDYNHLSQQVIRYLEGHCAENVSLDDLAAALGHSKTYLCVAFKRDTGTTILACMNTIRIRRAAELITYSDYSLAQVSAMCGFATVSHFNRVFSKYAGITPGQCRRAFPAGILVNRDGIVKARKENTFLYSVLARRRITAEQLSHTSQLADVAD